MYYYNAVKKMQNPLDDWKTFTIAKIIGSASTFDRAMDKLSMAEKILDISTDSDCNVAKKKRRRHAQKVFSSEEENSESDEELSMNKYLSPFPMPPQARYGKRSALNIGSSKACATQSNTDARNDHENIDVFCDKNCNSCKVMLSFQQDILKLAVEINLRGKKFETMLQNIMDKMTNQDTTTSISDILNSDILNTDFYPEYLPAQTLADFHTAEDKWKTDKEYRENVVQLFIKCKGADIKNTTYTIMGNLMSNSVAMLYSWTGAKQNKEKFSKSPFHTVLQTTIMQLHNDATLQGIKKCITDWLRHAKERHARNSTDNE